MVWSLSWKLLGQAGAQFPFAPKLAVRTQTYHRLTTCFAEPYSERAVANADWDVLMARTLP